MSMRLCLVFAGAIVAESSILKEKSKRIAPTLKPESSQKFFNEDYPGDKRPKVDVLHFKHPYPVVQDSEEFDADFVKDENTDNGEWKAQTEYDRLRHKLRELKKKAAEAEKKKEEEKAELDKAMQKYEEDMAKAKAEVAEKQSEVVEPVPPVKPVKPQKPAKPAAPTTQAPEAQETPTAKEEESSWSWSWSWPWSWPKSPEAPKVPEIKMPKAKVPEVPEAPKKSEPEPEPEPEPTPKPLDINGAAKDVEKAMKNLEECQNELEQAKAELKRLMAELDEEKRKLSAAHAKVEQALQKQHDAEAVAQQKHTKYSEEASEHAAAETAYLKQQQKVKRLHAELEAAAAKVKAMRDAEDMDGGVYPTTKKSGATSVALSQLFTPLVVLAAILHVA